MTPELKEKMRIGREKAKERKMQMQVLNGEKVRTDGDFVSKTDFDSFKNSVVGILENISNKLNAEPERKVLLASEPEKTKKILAQTPSDEDVVHNLTAIGSEYDQVFEKYFDKKDGFKAMLKGVNFKIEVPKSLSNAQEAHWSLYNKDVRHKVLDGQDLVSSMEKYCRLVASNLNYKRNVMLKI